MNVPLVAHLDRCPATGKIAFRSETLAALWLTATQAARDSGERPGPKREAAVYRCPHTDRSGEHWHMSSWSADDYRARTRHTTPPTVS